MRGVAPQQTAKANDRVILPRFRERARGRGDFESAGDADDLDGFVFRA